MKGHFFPLLVNALVPSQLGFFIFSGFSAPFAEILCCVLKNSKWVKEEEGVISQWDGKFLFPAPAVKFDICLVVSTVIDCVTCLRCCCTQDDRDRVLVVHS